MALDYFGDMKSEYEARNRDYIVSRSASDKSLDEASVRSAIASEPQVTAIRSVNESSSAAGDSLSLSRPATAGKPGETSPGDDTEANTPTPLRLFPSPAVPDVTPVPCSSSPLHFDSVKCIGCNSCARVCQCDVLLPSPTKGEHPVVVYPGECWYCGACVMACPREGAIRLSHPLMNRAKFVPVMNPS